MPTEVEFLNELYDDIGRWATNRAGMTEVADVLPQRVRRWMMVGGKHPGQGSIPFSLDLQKGAIFTKEGLIFGVSLGEGYRGYYEGGIRSVRLQFGGYKFGLEDMKKEELDLNFFAGMVNKKAWGSWMAGEVYKFGKRVGVECWADGQTFGGAGINQWSQESLLSDAGKSVILGMIARLVERS